MDLEAPADAWYVWVGVALVSAAALGIVLELPSGPPPDANAAANTIDRVGGSQFGATATYEHDARFYWVNGARLAMKNEHGVAKATIGFGNITPVDGNGSLRRVLQGEDIDDVFSSSGALWWRTTAEEHFHQAVLKQHSKIDRDDPEWRATNETLRVRVVHYEIGPRGEEKRAILVDM